MWSADPTALIRAYITGALGRASGRFAVIIRHALVNWLLFSLELQPLQVDLVIIYVEFGSDFSERFSYTRAITIILHKSPVKAILLS